MVFFSHFKKLSLATHASCSAAVKAAAKIHKTMNPESTGWLACF